MRKKMSIIVAMVFMTSACLSACGTNETQSTQNTIAETVAQSDITNSTDTKLDIDLDDEDTVNSWDDSSAVAIKFNGDSISASDSNVTVNGSVVTISASGTYVLSGTLNDGCIVVNSTGKETVRLVMNGVNITSKTTAPIIVTDAGKVLVTLADGTTNTVTDTTRTTTEAEDYTATFYSKSDVVINGTGTLNVNAGYRNGIKSTDDLKIVSGTINVESTEDGIVGKDFLAVAGGTINITSGQDGMKSTYDTDTTKGNIVINGGNITIKSANDGIQSENILMINGGTINIYTGGGAAASTKSNSSNDMMMGNFRGQTTQTQTTASDTSDSMKGLKAEKYIYFYGGDIIVDSQDDSVHANGTVIVNDGALELSSGDDGIHADDELTINGGSINISKSYEGLEGCKLTINGGDIKLVSSDDGMNAASSSATTSTVARPGQTTNQASGIALVINGGTIYVNASGDGLDSNGSLTINGGYVIVEGPTSSNDAALDTDGTMEFNGGTIMAFGSSGMLETPTSVNNIYCIVDVFSSTAGGSEFTIKDESGNVVMSYTPSKAYSAAIIASADIENNKTYTVSAGTNSTSIKTSGSITTSGANAGQGGGMMQPGGNNQQQAPNRGGKGNGV